MQPLRTARYAAVVLFVAVCSQCALTSPVSASSDVSPLAAASNIARAKTQQQQQSTRHLETLTTSRSSSSIIDKLAKRAGHTLTFRRRLHQLAGLANFMVGIGIEGADRAINAAGAASQLKNFYGVEGLGMRHRLGALPAPGGLELLLLGGPKALPGPKGFTAGFIGGTAEALAATANPINAVMLGSVLQDMAASSGIGNLVGAQGLSGLGLQTGTAAMLADTVIRGAGNSHPAAAVAAGGSGSGVGGLGKPALMNLGVQGHLVGQQTGVNMHPLQGNLVGTAGLGQPSAATDQSAAAAALIAQAGQTAGTLVSNAGQITGAMITGASQMAAQNAAAAGHGGTAGMSQVARAVTGSTVSGVGGMFKGAGRFLDRITSLTGPGAPAAVSDGATVSISSSGSSVPESGVSGGSDMVSVTPGWHGPQGFTPGVSSTVDTAGTA